MPMETEGHGREFGRRQKMRAKCTVEFVCKYCQRRFTKPYNLMIHERSHKDDVTFSCEVCGKSFKRQDNLKQHRYCQLLSRYYSFLRKFEIDEIEEILVTALPGRLTKLLI